MLKFIVTSPKNYDELLNKLCIWSGILTFLFCFFLGAFEIIPTLTVDPKKMPPIWEPEKLDYVAKYCILPLLVGGFVCFLSRFLPLHDVFAKLLGVRFYWERYYVINPMLQEAGISGRSINSELHKKVMYDVYYPGTKDIDQHYVHLFWNFAFFFWFMFEHLILAVFVGLIVFFKGNSVHAIGIGIWTLFVASLAIIYLHVVVFRRSRDQAREVIKIQKHRDLLTGLFP